jgi:hypothetical protein
MVWVTISAPSFGLDPGLPGIGLQHLKEPARQPVKPFDEYGRRAKPGFGQKQLLSIKLAEMEHFCR